MYQVTAIYQDCEVGYGEADGLDYAVEECALSIESFYASLPAHSFRLLVLRDGEKVQIDASIRRTFRETYAVV